MKTLFLLRHAKSDWSHHLSDQQRPLNQRGQQDAVKIGRWLEHNALPINLVLCSTAVRTRQTWGLLQKQLSSPAPVQFIEALYLAPLSELLAQLESALQTQEQVLLIGHNPGLDELMMYLCQQPPPFTSSGKLMTTANLAVLHTPDASLKPHGAALQQLIRPKLL